MGLIVDLFAGGGGASLGIRQALGRDPDVAINHDREAVAMHAANHPGTRHFCQDVWRVLPQWVTHGTPVDLLWASPDCKHFSKAKGGKPREQAIRDLAWVVVEWARAARPAVIILENVEEFRTWGPLDDEGRPVKDLAGSTFAEWLGQLKRAGYRVEHRELRACDYGAPTIRKRLFVIARRDGQPIVWPEPTHGPGRDNPWRTAAECIDWSLPCPSIFDRTRPLAENTLKRIAAGVQRYVLEAAEPFIIPTAHQDDARAHDINEPLRTITGSHRGDHALVSPSLVGVGGRAGQSRPRGADEPMATVTAKGDTALAGATLIQTGYGERPGQPPRVPGLNKPLGTVVAGGSKHALVSAFLAGAGGPSYGGKPTALGRPSGTLLAENHQALVAGFLAKHYGGVVGSPLPLPQPIGTITGVDHHSLVTSHLCKLYGTCKDGQDLRQPAPTTTAGGLHAAEVRAFLVKYYGQAIGQAAGEALGTVTARDRFGLVTVLVQGEPYVLADIGLRMLQPRELFRAQGFPDSYVIDLEAGGKPLTKSAQVRLCGNSVCPPIAAALVRANAGHLAQREAA